MTDFLAHAPAGNQSRPRAALVVAALVLSWAVLSARQLPEPSSPAAAVHVVQGHIVDAANGAVLPRARIVFLPPLPHVPLLSDDAGSFRVVIPSSGQIRVLVSKAGYATRVVDLTSDGVWRQVQIALTPGAAVTGRVVDRAGAPVVGAVVGARAVTPEGPARDAPPDASSTTDDRGRYRLGGLPAGEHDVTVTVIREPQPGITPRRVVVNPGTGLDGVDFVLGTVASDSSSATCRRLLATRMNEFPAGTIHGRVLDAAGRPACANVRITRDGQSGPTGGRALMTDAQGQFVFTALEPGSYTIEAHRAGTVPLLYLYGEAPDADTGRTIALHDGDAVGPVGILLSRGGTVTGTILDDFGEPAQGVVVKALRLRFTGGRMRALATPPFRPIETDDRGQYRLSGLTPGSYLIVAEDAAAISSRDPTSVVHSAPMYFPGTPDVAAAVPLEVGVEQDVTGVDFVLARFPLARVTGSAFDAERRPLNGIVLLAPSHRSGAVLVDARHAPVDDDGAFAIPNVAPGDYVLQAVGARTFGRPAELGIEYVAVGNDDPAPAFIQTSVGSTVEGRMVLEGDRFDLGRFSLTAHAVNPDYEPPASRGVVASALSSEGRVWLSGLVGPVRFALQAPANWYLKSVVIAGVDVTDTPFHFGPDAQTYRDAEFVVSNRGATVIGRVTDADGASVGGYAIVMFPTAPDQWFAASRYMRHTRAGHDATFTVSGMPPGDYWIAALNTPGSTFDWLDPIFLHRLASRAARLTLDEGAHAAVTLRLAD